MKSNGGFTILEIVVGIAIASMILAFAYSSVNFSAAVCSDMEEQARVAGILESAAEKIFNMTGSGSFSSVTSGLTFSESDIPLLRNFPPDRRNLNITVSEYADNPKLKSVAIVFTWTPATQKAAKTQTLCTLVANPN